MLTIWKYPLELKDISSHRMPKGAAVLSIAMQAGRPHLWALVDTEATLEWRTFATYGTGNPVRDVAKRNVGEKQIFLGTYLFDSDQLVFHVFEITAPPIPPADPSILDVLGRST